MQPRLAPRLMQLQNTRIYNDKNKVCSRDAHTYNVVTIVTIVICHFVIFKTKRGGPERWSRN